MSQKDVVVIAKQAGIFSAGEVAGAVVAPLSLMYSYSLAISDGAATYYIPSGLDHVPYYHPGQAYSQAVYDLTRKYSAQGSSSSSGNGTVASTSGSGGATGSSPGSSGNTNGKSSGSGGQTSNPQTTNSLPTDEGQLSHIFRNADGHLLDTATNRQLLTNVANDPTMKLGTDQWGNTWYAQALPDGTQVWAQTRNGQIINGGLNQTPRGFNPITGLSSPVKP